MICSICGGPVVRGSGGVLMHDNRKGYYAGREMTHDAELFEVFENPRYEYMTREFPTKVTELRPPSEAVLEREGWRRAWADIGVEGTFVVYKRERV